MIDSSGVMPLPAANARVALAVARRRAATLKWPIGGITSMRRARRSASLAHVENTPPGARLTAMRNGPSCTAEQIEYERRTSSPSMSARSVRCWPWIEAERVAQRRRHVERDRDRVARLALDAATGQRMELAHQRRDRSVRLEIVERLEAVDAAVLRLARRRAEARRAPCVRVEPQRGQATCRAGAGATG